MKNSSHLFVSTLVSIIALIVAIVRVFSKDISMTISSSLPQMAGTSRQSITMKTSAALGVSAF